MRVEDYRVVKIAQEIIIDEKNKNKRNVTTDEIYQIITDIVKFLNVTYFDEVYVIKELQRRNGVV